MTLIAPFDHPLALHPVVGSGIKPSGRPWAPPPLPVACRAPTPTGEIDVREAVARRLTHVLLTDALNREQAVAELTETVVEDVVVWSPSLFVESRDDLLTRLLESDDSLADVVLTISCGSSDGDETVFLEWQLRGRFRRAALLNEDLLVEPSGALVESSGVVVMRFSGDRVQSIGCYYDLLGLFEQLLL